MGKFFLVGKKDAEQFENESFLSIFKQLSEHLNLLSPQHATQLISPAFCILPSQTGMANLSITCEMCQC